MAKPEFGSPDHQRKGHEGLQKGEHDRAIAQFNQTIKQDPKNIPAFMGRGRSFLALGRYQKAIADFDQVLTIEPDNQDATHARQKANDLFEIYGAIQDNIIRDW